MLVVGWGDGSTTQTMRKIEQLGVFMPDAKLRDTNHCVEIVII